MSKTKAGERKRTVTVVVGPQTELLLEAYKQAAMASGFSYEFSVTSFVGAELTDGLRKVAELYGIPLPSGWESHFD